MMDSVAQGFGATTPAASLPPTLSVVIPIHDVEPWIAECLRSIQVQSLSSLEIILVDDQSSDRTVEIIREIARADPRIRLLANPGSGSASARNHGVSVATGSFLAFTDGDDLVPQGAYEALVGSLRSSGSDLSMGDYLTFTTTKTWRRGNNLPIYGTERVGIALVDEPRLLRDRVCWNKVYRLDWWRWHDIRFADSRRSNDIFAMTLAYAMATMDIIPVTTYLYRRRSDGSSMTSRRGALDSLLQHFEQEVSCYRIVAATCDERVQLAYLGGVLEHDMWGPLDDLLRRDAPVEEADRLAVEEIFALATILIAASPWPVRRALEPRQRWTYDLIAARQLDLLPILPGQLPVAEVWRRLVDQPDQVFAQYARWASLLGDSTKATFRHVLAGALIPGLSAQSAEVDDETLASGAALIVQFQRTWVPRARLTERQLRVVLAASRGDMAALRDAIRAELMAAVPMVVKSSGSRHLTL
ncbi:MAG: glycosyltransferase, partial [Cryobacterium sp.]|nr:glycosyltransferase [Cryobacterium sp.]